MYVGKQNPGACGEFVINGVVANAHTMLLCRQFKFQEDTCLRSLVLGICFMSCLYVFMISRFSVSFLVIHIHAHRFIQEYGFVCHVDSNHSFIIING